MLHGVSICLTYMYLQAIGLLLGVGGGSEFSLDIVAKTQRRLMVLNWNTLVTSLARLLSGTIAEHL